jgi:hypothetical protein
MQRSGVETHPQRKDRACMVLRSTSTPASSQFGRPSFVSHVLRGLVWGWVTVPLCVCRQCYAAVLPASFTPVCDCNRIRANDGFAGWSLFLASRGVAASQLV